MSDLFCQRVGMEIKHVLCMIDLDHFKLVNDTSGHAVGDLLLCELAGTLTAQMRAGDWVGRLGGDEFALFLDGVDERGAEIAARRILDALAQPFKVDDMSFSVGASIGVALFPQDGRSLDTLIKCADTAMYQAKDAGGNRIKIFGRSFGPFHDAFRLGEKKFGSPTASINGVACRSVAPGPKVDFIPSCPN